MSPNDDLNGVRGIFRALRNRNYRLFFIGQGLSLIGTWIQSVALGWLVYSRTHSAWYLGLVGFSGQIASMLLSPFAGVWVDRLPKHRLLVATQTLFMFQAFALAALALTGIVEVWHVILLSLFSGIVVGFDTPARQAFVVEMIENKEDLPNAIALNSSIFNSARLVGPAIAGILVASLGEGACFTINGISYLAVIIALLAMQVSAAPAQPATKSISEELKEGFAYTFGFVPVRSVILFLGLVSFVSMPYSVLMPIFAAQVLHGGANVLGFLTAASGVGALLGAMFLAYRKSVIGLGKWIPLAAGILGVGLMMFSFSRMLWLSILMLVCVGFGMIVQMAASNTILQTIVDDNLRGRVMSFYTMAFLGTTPFGSLLAGGVAARIGAPYTVLIGGLVALVGAALFAFRLPQLRRLVHPVYCDKGVLPPNLCGINAASERIVPPEYE